ncbi:MAG: endonuclease III [Chlamydiae bacterium]|nr:endonuclease III [Chlamydiota bacterium]MBI3276839.1 endonuclease III [Chlamydiota bacterium]
MDPIDKIIQILKKEIRQWKTPAVGIVANESQDPFKVLISCLISLRTKDEVTNLASQRLFAQASTPQEMLKLNPPAIEKLIYPAGFYKTKAKTILEISKTLLTQFQGKVPNKMDELLSLKGVGRKTANLVITLGFNQDGICVDTHVHRISNRLGLIKTKTPDESEFALMKVLPKPYWKIYNDLLVPYGQNLCRPISPFCSLCKIAIYCKKRGVLSHR